MSGTLVAAGSSAELGDLRGYEDSGQPGPAAGMYTQSFRILHVVSSAGSPLAPLGATACVQQLMSAPDC